MRGQRLPVEISLMWPHPLGKERARGSGELDVGQFVSALCVQSISKWDTSGSS